MNGKRNSRKAKNIRSIPLKIVRQGLEMNPSKHEWKGDRDSYNTSPHDQHVRAPTRFAAAQDKLIQSKITGYAGKPLSDVSHQMLRSQKNLPTTFPVQCGRRTLQPHRISIGNAE